MFVPTAVWAKELGGDDVFSCQKQNYERRSFPHLTPAAAFDFAAVVPAVECFPLPPLPYLPQGYSLRSDAVTFDRFILQELSGFVTIMAINDTLACRLLMCLTSQFFFFFFIYITTKQNDKRKCIQLR